MPRTKFTTAAFAAAILLLLLPACSAQSTVESGGSSDTAKADLYDEMAAASRDMLTSRYPDAQIPSVEIVRYITADEWGTTMAACMTEQGFGATVRSDGGISYDLTAPGQDEAQAIAKYTCDLQYPVEQTKVTDAQLRILYDYNVGELVPCLEGQGYPVSQAPSFTTYKASYETQPWVPYSDVPAMSQDQFDELNRVCPQLPEELGGRPRTP